MGAFSQDLLYSLRSLRKAPAFSAVAIVTLALGIGANTAIFSVLNAVLLRPVPFSDPERVVHLAWDGGDHLQSLSGMKFKYWHDHAPLFDAVATWRSRVARAIVEEEPSTIHELSVSADFFAAVGRAPERGPGFTSNHFVPGGPDGAIISHAMWETRFARAADLTGRTIRLEDKPVAIVGVLPKSFIFPYQEEPIDVVVPLRLSVDPNDIAEDWPAIARLRDGVTHEHSRTENAALLAGFRAAYPSQVAERDRGMRLATFNELYVDRGVQRALVSLMTAVAFVLLMACANVANLFLARANERRREIAVRAALGAGQARISRLVLADSVVIAVAAAVLGVALGSSISQALIALTPAEIPRLTSAGIDWRVLVFTAAISCATSVLLGGVAAWLAVRLRPATVLNASRGSSGSGRMRSGLLVVQSALAMILLVGAGLLVVTVTRLSSFDRGFDVEGLIAARLTTPPASGITARQLWEFEQRVFRHLDGVPMIASVTAANSLPLERGVNTPMTIAGRPDAVGTVEWRAITPGYFPTLGIRRISGRSFEPGDSAGAPAVAIVNDAFARRYFGGANPLGQRIEIGRSPRPGSGTPAPEILAVEIIGVVADVRDVSLRAEPRRTIYVPQAQASSRLSTLLRAMPVFIARPGSDRAGLERVLREAIHAADRSLPPPQVFPLAAAVAGSLAREQFAATLLSVLAALALTLTALGVHGALAYTVQQRRREIGIRMALGARAGDVARLVMAQGMAPVAAGLAIGVAAAIALSRFVAGFLWGVSPTDPMTFTLVAAILLGVAVVASWIPARKAVNVDPASTLTHD
jgi:predicted permease